MLFNKNKHRLKCLLLSVIAFITLTTLHAATQPKFTFTPTTPTKWTLPVNGETTVQYRVTNQLTNTYTLTMAPLPNVAQRTSEAGDCSNPFTLAHQESCLLTLPLIGSQLTQDLIGGPIVCKTKGYGNNTPDPFLCSQPSSADQLNIRRAGFEEAELSVSPATLTLINGETQSLTITNHSLTVTALDIKAILPDTLSSYVTQDFSDCASVAPQASCHLDFYNNQNQSVTPTTIDIKGTNTKTITATMGISYLSITVSPSSITLEASFTSPVSKTLIITNNAIGTDASFNALNITANLSETDLNGLVTQSPTNGCSSLAPGASCTLTYTPLTTNAAGPTDVSLTGTNTLSAPATITVTAAGYATIEITTGTPMWLIPNGNGLTMTITNTSTLNDATGITAILGSLTGYISSSGCSGTLSKNGGTCNITFTPTPDAGVIAAHSVTIQGTNTNTVTGSISVAYVLYIANKGTELITKCSIMVGAPATLKNCMNTGKNLHKPKGLAITYATGATNYYLSATDSDPDRDGTVTSCKIDKATGLLTECSGDSLSDSNFKTPNGITFNSSYTYGYITSSGTNNGSVTNCPVSNGLISINANCVVHTSSNLPNPQGIVLNVAESYAWSGNYSASYLGLIPIESNGSIGNIGLTQGRISAAQVGIILAPATYVYVAAEGTSQSTSSIYRCKIENNGSGYNNLDDCTAILTGSPLNGPQFMTLSVIDNDIYITNKSSNSIVRCGISSDSKSFINCGTVTLDNSISLSTPEGIVALNLP